MPRFENVLELEPSGDDNALFYFKNEPRVQRVGGAPTFFLDPSLVVTTGVKAWLDTQRITWEGGNLQIGGKSIPLFINGAPKARYTLLACVQARQISYA